MTTIISPGMGMGSFFLNRSLRSLITYRKTRQTRPRMRVVTLVLVMSLTTALTLCGRGKRTV